MIVLSRKKNESIIINDDITVIIVEIRGDKVRLGIEHPREVSVHRNEVYEAIRRNMQQSESTATPADSADAIRQRIAALRNEITELETRL
jgi:carbon storage regulator